MGLTRIDYQRPEPPHSPLGFGLLGLGFGKDRGNNPRFHSPERQCQSAGHCCSTQRRVGRIGTTSSDLKKPTTVRYIAQSELSYQPYGEAKIPLITSRNQNLKNDLQETTAFSFIADDACPAKFHHRHVRSSVIISGVPDLLPSGQKQIS